MKKRVLIGAVLLLAAAATAGADLRIPEAGWPMAIGHRGLGQKHKPEPENSVVALVKALEQGASAVEFDMQLSSDGETVLAHDDVLDRMTDGTGCVASKTFAELRKLHLRDGSGAVHPDLIVPTFAEALEAIKKYDSSDRPFLADLHIKVYDGLHGDVGVHKKRCPRTDYKTLTRKILDQVKAAGLADRVLYTSFDERVLNLIRQEQPEARVGYLAIVRHRHRIEYAARRHYDAVALSVFGMEAEDVQLAHSAGMKVLAWSPSELPVMRDLLENKHVDGVIADDLGNAIEAVGSRQP